MTAAAWLLEQPTDDADILGCVGQRWQLGRDGLGQRAGFVTPHGGPLFTLGNADSVVIDAVGQRFDSESLRT